MAAAIPEILGAVTEGGAEAGAAEGAAGGAADAAGGSGGGGLGKMVKDTLSGGKVGEFLFGAQSLGLKHQGGADGLGTSSDGAADGVRSA